LQDKPDALIVDFFAGSGTTAHAAMLLNAEDEGRRRTIMLTDNDVGEKMAKRLRASGHFPGDVEFDRHGIFESVTRPRLEAAIVGKLPDGTAIKGEYLNERPMADGFEENVEFFRLDYLDPDDVELGRCLESIHPLLWLAAGAKGERPMIRKRD